MDNDVCVVVVWVVVGRERIILVANLWVGSVYIHACVYLLRYYMLLLSAAIAAMSIDGYVHPCRRLLASISGS